MRGKQQFHRNPRQGKLQIHAFVLEDRITVDICVNLGIKLVTFATEDTHLQCKERAASHGAANIMLKF